MPGRESETRPFWRRDRDETTRVSTEATNGRQPLADQDSPARDDGPGPAPAKSVPRGNPELLRSAIDRGRTGDKVAHPDPAAAPLGTDDEAAGTPPAPREVREAMRHETAPRATEDDIGRPRLTLASLVILGTLALIAVAFGISGT
ncbi:MAG: hypothetical protein SFW09_05255 [Hyphomicrobiaceae bacterium]|nr:hypothetical protein [Hyphomicrobiaceae bacterium]